MLDPGLLKGGGGSFMGNISVSDPDSIGSGSGSSILNQSESGSRPKVC